MKSVDNKFTVFIFGFWCVLFLGWAFVFGVFIPKNEEFLFSLIGEIFFLIPAILSVNLLIWSLKGYNIIHIDLNEQQIFFYRKGLIPFNKEKLDIKNIKQFLLEEEFQDKYFTTSANRNPGVIESGRLIFERATKKWNQNRYFRFGAILNETELQEVHRLIKSKISTH